jgi:hypothetical protein
MKSILSFLRTTLTGGVLFFLPLVFIMIALKHGAETIGAIVGPLATRLGIENIAGKATVTILVVLVIVFICFIGGLLARSRHLKKMNDSVDSLLMAFIPGYDKFKAQAKSKLGGKDEKIPLLLFTQNSWMPALKIETAGDWATYFFPEDAGLNAGFVRTLPSAMVQENLISKEQLVDILTQQGKGLVGVLGA